MPEKQEAVFFPPPEQFGLLAQIASDFLSSFTCSFSIARIYKMPQDTNQRVSVTIETANAGAKIIAQALLLAVNDKHPGWDSTLSRSE